MNRLTFTVAAATLAACGAWTSPASADLIYATTVIGASPRTSDYGTVTGFGFRTFDNFTSASGATIERVSWSGLWFGDVTPAPAPAPLVDTWRIAFHASSGGVPGAALWTQDVAAADVASTFTGNGVLTAGSTYNVSLYDYALDLPSAFNIAGGVEYWISVLAIADNFNPMFAIRGATGGDDASYQQTLGAAMSVTSAASVARDRAFVIEGTLQVPEPGSLALGGMALVALAMSKRRSLASRSARPD